MEDIKFFLMYLFFPSWFKYFEKEYTIEEAEKKYTVLDIRLGKDPVVFGFMNSQWEVLKSKMQKGDKLFLYRSSDYATSRQGGMEKFILKRNDKQIYAVVTKTYSSYCGNNYVTKILSTFK